MTPPPPAVLPISEPRSATGHLIRLAKEAPGSFCEALVTGLHGLGVRQAFGLVGGAIAPLVEALGESALQVVHARHEGGAAFMAVEAHFASDRPTLLYTTTGPGLTNALTGVMAARWESAKLVVLSGFTAPAQRGRWACQETSAETMPLEGLYSPGPVFHYAAVIDHPAQLDVALSRIAAGFRRPGGFIAHLSLPLSTQSVREVPIARPSIVSEAIGGCAPSELDRFARLLTEQSFAMWVGFGARHAARAVRALAERTRAPVMCSPRGKGIFPEQHPQFIGVTGLGGHSSVEAQLSRARPAHMLVLGTRLGEPTSFWNKELLPTDSMIHVDIDPSVPGAAYPTARTHAVVADVGTFLEGLLERIPARVRPRTAPAFERPVVEVPSEPRDGWVRPDFLMGVLQRRVVDATDAVVMSESGNAFAWSNHVLRFDAPGRYRVSVGFGSMGHSAAGVVGAALATGKKAVALVGDGSMLMASELSTAVQYGAKAVWVVLNDAQYGMVDQGMRALGLKPIPTAIPRADFAAWARAVGADGVRVASEHLLESALSSAMKATGPFVVDVLVQPDAVGPFMRRIQNLALQGARGGK